MRGSTIAAMIGIGIIGAWGVMETAGNMEGPVPAPARDLQTPAAGRSGERPLHKGKGAPGWMAEMDPFRRCAVKAVNGEFGEIAEWQRVGYQVGLEASNRERAIRQERAGQATGPSIRQQQRRADLKTGLSIRQTTAWVTQYYPAEGYARGEETASGYGCSERVAAATALPLFSFVWIEQVGIRQVLDTGAARNDAIARAKGAEMWVDIWVERPGDFGFETGVMEATIIGRDGDGD